MKRLLDIHRAFQKACVCVCVHSVWMCVRACLWPHQLQPANRGAPAFLADTVPLSYWPFSNPQITDALSHWTRPTVLAHSVGVCVCVCVCGCVYVCETVTGPWKMQLLVLWEGSSSPESFILTGFQSECSTCWAEPLLNSCVGSEKVTGQLFDWTFEKPKPIWH